MSKIKNLLDMVNGFIKDDKFKNATKEALDEVGGQLEKGINDIITSLNSAVEEAVSSAKESVKEEKTEEPSEKQSTETKKEEQSKSKVNINKDLGEDFFENLVTLGSKVIDVMVSLVDEVEENVSKVFTDKTETHDTVTEKERLLKVKVVLEKALSEVDELLKNK